MVILSLLCAILVFNAAQSENVTTTEVTVTTSEVPLTTSEVPLTTSAVTVVKYNDVCTNGGGAPKTDATGKVMRCTQFTVTGASCANECAKKSKGYYWCMTNVNIVDGGEEWWDYCSLWGYTTNNAKCTDTCGKRGEVYYWCHTDKSDTSKWDKCSPQGRVKPVQYTYKGSLCMSECKKGGEKYYWCNKNLDFCTSRRGASCDDNWDYCSPDPWHTRYNTKCKQRCSKNRKDYYWCYEEDGSWEYCSPASQMGVDVKDHVEVTIHGVKCSGACSKRGSTYYWCKHFGEKDIWDYCSPSPKLTIHNVYCTDKCSRRNEKYNWCNTADSWDYCSPTASSGNIRRGYETQTTNIFVWIFAVPMGILCCVGLCFLFKRIC